MIIFMFLAQSIMSTCRLLSETITAQSTKCVFLGSTTPQKGFLCYDPQVQRIRVSRNVVFFDNPYFFQQNLDPPASTYTVFFPGLFDCETYVKFNLNFVYHMRSNETTTGDPPPDLPTAFGSPRSPYPETFHPYFQTSKPVWFLSHILNGLFFHHFHSKFLFIGITT